ncbi:hypothetical protein TIFTF001_005193 [Ficus carica]|uniref:Uncharacterized protein n=1 Tax=Ficus carica TaxID=3494 RepID=A0AA88CYA4_FICCA|nr:hypothetical protein TIFTF001_005193 [Ficus carica]
MLVARHKDELGMQIDRDRPLCRCVAQVARHGCHQVRIDVQGERLDSDNGAEIDVDGGRVARQVRRLGAFGWPRARIKGQLRCTMAGG